VIERVDLSHRIGNDPAYLAIVDVDRYAKDLPDWTFDTLTAKLVAAANEGAAFAWGTPEALLTVRVTTDPIDAEARARCTASTSGRLITSGSLCLASYTSLTMCAQFSRRTFPQPGDLAFQLRPGSYDVTVHRLFTHADGAQFADDLPTPGDHYVVVLAPADPAVEPPRASAIPWALRARTA